MQPLARQSRRPLSLVLSLLTIAAALNAQNRLSRAPFYPLGGTVFNAITSDFDGDGRSDVLAFVTLAGSSGFSEVTLTLGNADGTYGTPKVVATYPVGVTGYVAAGDFNGDGKIDFAVALFSRSIRVFLNNGDGTFRAAPGLNSTGGNPISFLAGQMTNDTHTDLVLGLQANDGTGSIYVFPGNGDGTFAPRKVTSLPSLLPSVMTLGDANRDGNQDIALSDGNSSYQILLGRGDGTFIVKPFASLSTYGNFGALMITDYNGDSVPDLIIANQGNYLGYSGTGEIPSLLVLPGYGDGTFNNSFTTADAGNSGWGLAVADMNKDGRSDLLVYNMLSSDISIKMRSSTGALTAAPAHRYAVADSYRSFIALLTGDVNGDGKRDALLVNTRGVQVLLGVGGGNLRAPAATELQSFSLDLKAADLNHDGNADLVIRGLDVGNSQTGYIESDKLFLALGNRSQTLTKEGPLFTTDTGSNLGPLGIGNFNTDGNLDILIRQGVLFNNGAAQFTGPNSQPSNIGETGGTPADYNTVVGDLNGDGNADLVTAANTTLTVSLGNGDGTFQPDVTYSLGGTGANAVVLRDINGDGKLDAITANRGSLSVSVFLGKGDGTFQAAREFNLPQTATPIDRPFAVAIGDFNRDGKQDIAVARLNSISILLGNGTGGFTNGATFPAGSNLEGIAAVSLRSNSLIDLVVPDTGNLTVRLFYGNGNGTFGPAVVYQVGQRPNAIVTGDFNGDGSQDVAVALGGSTALPVFYNQGGTFITLTASNTSPAAGQPVTFTGSVTASEPGNGTPTGFITFKDGNSIQVYSHYTGGIVSWGSPGLTAGTHTISFIYSGNSTFNPHTAKISVTVH